jgi:hypothetical protein
MTATVVPLYAKLSQAVAEEALIVMPLLLKSTPAVVPPTPDEVSIVAPTMVPDVNVPAFALIAESDDTFKFEAVIVEAAMLLPVIVPAAISFAVIVPEMMKAAVINAPPTPSVPEPPYTWKVAPFVVSALYMHVATRILVSPMQLL